MMARPRILQTIAVEPARWFGERELGNKPTIAILGTRYPDFSVEEAILGSRGVRLVGGDGATEENIVAQAATAEVVLAGASPRFGATVINRLSCRGIVRYGVGVESVDLDAAATKGMWVAYVPDYGTDAVAVHAVALLLASLRRLITADSLVKSGGWGIAGLRPLRAPESTTVGIIGLGRIGRRVAQLLRPFGFRLLGHDTYVEVASVAEGVRGATLDELLTAADAVTLHVPGRQDERPLLGSRELKLLKPGAVLVNTARGSLVDEIALRDGLLRGAPALAALDVFAHEPPGRVFDAVAGRMILTPHMAWYTEESELDLRTKAAHEALRILDGEAPTNVVAGPTGAA